MNNEFGVNYFGFFNEISGIAQATRSNFEALQLNNIKVNPYCYKYEHKIVVDNSNPKYNPTNANYNINIFHINIDKISSFLSEFTTESLKDKYNIAYWAWEFPEIPDEALKILSLFDELWVPTNFCTEIFALHSNVPVIRIPHPVEAFSINNLFNKNDYGINKDAFIYLTMFDSDSTFERKNPLDTIKAFKSSFNENDLNCFLIIKTHNFNKNLHIKDIIYKEIGNHKNIIVIDEKMSYDKLHSLIQQCNVLLSLHAAEGFGLTIAEAMSYGKIAIATGYSGNLDFMNVNNSMLLKYKITEIQNEHGIIKKGFKIAKPCLNNAIESIKYVYSNYDKLDFGTNAKAYIENELNKNIIGSKISDRLNIINQNFIKKTDQNKSQDLMIHDYEIKIQKLNLRIKYLEKSLYNKIRKGINNIFKKLKKRG